MGQHQYPLFIGSGVLASQLSTMPGITKGRQAMVVTNETLRRLYPEKIEALLLENGLSVESCILPDGEQYKTLATLSQIYDRLLAVHANRQTLLIAFGGGVIGDLAGLAAATFMRGIPLLQVPTTLLAQVDSSIGGKTGVNHTNGKNAIGAFKQPDGVIMDLDFLKTLPLRELRAGLFELVKHGIIRDRALFEFLESNTAALAGNDPEFWEEAIFRSCRVKAAVVEADETERDLRAILNFGHTMGHLIETHTNYTRYLHGEAVGAGMLFAAFVSRKWHCLPEADWLRIRALLGQLHTPMAIPPLSEPEFERLLLHDKKASNRNLRFIISRGLGKVDIREETKPSELWPLFLEFTKDLPEVLRVEH